jgi:putative ABC transport system permease protein
MSMPLVEDVRTACHGLRRRPTFAAAVVLTLALALAANTAIFTLVHTILLRQLPFADADRLVAMHAVVPGSDRQPFSIPDFLDLQAPTRGLDGLVAWSAGSANLTAVEEPIRLQAQWTSPGFFELVGGRVGRGRLPLPEEERSGAPRVVLLGDGLWRTRFGADPGVIGRTLTLNDEPHTVIGVLPPEFVFFAAGADLVAPLDLDRHPRRHARGSALLRVVGRLAPGSSATAVTAALDAKFAQLRAEYPDSNASKQGVSLMPLADLVVGTQRQTLLVLQAAAGLVLLIACVNLASFLYVRLGGRRQELAVRSALGAGRRELLRQLLVESLVLAGIGGALGLLLAAALVRLLLAAGPANLPRAAEVSLNLWVVAFNLCLAVVAGLAFGILPALQSSGRKLAEDLRAGGRGGTSSRGRLRAALVAIEVALSLTLLVGAGLLVRSLVRLQETPPGFRSDHLLMVQLSLPKARYATPAAIARYADALRERLASLAGASDAGVASLTPLVAWRATVNFTIEGRSDVTREQAPLANYRAVTAGYFRTMGLPLRSGRDLVAADAADTVAVAVVSETLARRHFGEGGALGQRLWINDVESRRAVEVVGVVGDLKHTGLDAESTADLYVPYAQAPASVSVWLANILCAAVRTHGDPSALQSAVRREIQALDRDVAVANMRSMAAAYAGSLAPRRFNTRLLGLFSVAALALAIAGIYALTSFSVAERHREIGVRMALGSTRNGILGLILGAALAPVLAGILVGLVVALAGTRWLSGLLFGIGASDPVSFAVAAGSLVLAGLFASAIPAHRALRVEPVRALRAE